MSEEMMISSSPAALAQDGPTLRQVADEACKTFDIGAAVLVKPLFSPDIEDYDNGDMGEEFLSQSIAAAENAFTTSTQASTRTTSSTVESFTPGSLAPTAATSAANATATNYARVLGDEFNAVVIEHHLKWAPLLHTPSLTENNKNDNSVSFGKASVGNNERNNNENDDDDEQKVQAKNAAVARQILARYDFGPADAVVDWALARDMRVKGHCLVWHVTSPACLADLDATQLRQALKQHIFTVMGHFRDRIHVWDVVNEALAPDGSLAENLFWQKLGPSYIEDCFQWAHEADPTATLLYNDNKVEALGTKKSQGFYELLADLKAKGVPVHGCGMQAHFNAAGEGRNTCPTPRMVKQQIRRLGQLGLKVNISEMDVRVSGLSEGTRALAQKQIYHDILAAALSEKAFDGVWLWGFTDRHTWVTHFYYDDEPLIFDEAYKRKDAYYGVRDALVSLTPNGRVGGDGVLMDADVDVNGNRWGHLWIPEGATRPGHDLDDASAAAGGDARPDWEQASAAVTEDDEVGREIESNDGESGDEISIPPDLKGGDDLPEIS